MWPKPLHLICIFAKKHDTIFSIPHNLFPFLTYFVQHQTSFFIKPTSPRDLRDLKVLKVSLAGTVSPAHLGPMESPELTDLQDKREHLELLVLLEL